MKNERNVFIKRSLFPQYMRLAAVMRELSAINSHGSARREGGYLWLSDNFYLLSKASLEVLSVLKNARRAPWSVQKNEAVVLLLARRFYARTGGEFTVEQLERYVKGFQKSYCLSSLELNILPAMIMYSAIEAIYEAFTEKNGDTAVIGSAFRVLRFFLGYDFFPMLERLNRIEQMFMADPAGVYPKMDMSSRAMYRNRLTQLAEILDCTEGELAEKIMTAAQSQSDDRKRHIGYFLLARQDNHRWLSLLHEAAALSLSAAAAAAAGSVPVFFLAYLPLHFALKSPLQSAALRAAKPCIVPKIAIGGHIEPQQSVMITVCNLLPSEEKIAQAVARLKELYHIAPKGSVYICLLADLKESDEALRENESLAIDLLSSEIKRLNKELDDRFFLLVRPRKYSQTQGRYAAFERKRGAIAELCTMIKNGAASEPPLAFVGNTENMAGVKYLLALDSDTEIQLDTLPKLLGAAAHISNKAGISGGRVTQGYGIFAPKIGTSLDSAQQSTFSRLICNAGGVTAYDNSSSDFYQDIHGEALFCGKGLIDIAAFNELCADLPVERILSHDIIEGSLLRCCYVSDSEVCDGFPAKISSWLDRSHRWVRGDFQNIIFLFPRLFERLGIKKLPRLNTKSRIKIAENMRRSFVPVVSAVCILASALAGSRHRKLLLFLCGCLPSVSDQLGDIFAAIRKAGLSGFPLRYYSGARPRIAHSISAALLQLSLLFPVAAGNLDAVIRALYRTLFSKKSLLEWTTAADAESSKTGHFRRYLPVYLAYLLLIILKHAGPARLFGVCGLAALALFKRLERPLAAPQEQSGANAEQIDEYAASAWSFFDAAITAEDNFLPVDNIQETPVHAIAHRTSPTNIGLYLCSVVAAHDFGLIDTQELFERLENTLASVLALKKHSGHLYNWYDTKTLTPLNPRYISSVDSGNFACCLVALKNALTGFAANDSRFGELVTQIGQLENQMDFSFLYNDRRNQFTVGYNCASEKADNSYYDLLMSEARMTGYYAISKRLVPKRHWRSLGRLLTVKHGYAGLLSWSGTMFEYLMPHIFLPVYKGSLGFEAIKFCLHCQKSAGKKLKNGVWGISESAFYAFDPQLNYQYKANGTANLAISRITEDQAVVSPYSSFLALPFDENDAIANLEKLKEMGMVGELGYYEALDCSGLRTDGKPVIIRSYMAHHVAMSLLSLDNAKNDFVWQWRFMADPDMASAKELLCEKIETGAAVYRNKREIPEKKKKPTRASKTTQAFSSVSGASPNACMLSNGTYSLLATDAGVCWSTYSNLVLLRKSADPLRNPAGVFAMIKSGTRVYDLCKAPHFGEGRHSAVFSSSEIEYQMDSTDFSAAMSVCLHETLPCEVRTLTIKNNSALQRQCSVIVYYEPALCKNADMQSHPAYNKLFINTVYNDDAKCVTSFVTRRGSRPAAALSAGFVEDSAFAAASDRQLILTPPEGVLSLHNAFDADLSGVGWSPDTGVFLRYEVNLEPGESVCRRLILSAGQSPRESASNINKCRSSILKRSFASGDFLKEPASVIMRNIAPGLFFNGTLGRKITRSASENTLSKSSLWSLGISGDYPILVVEIDSGEDSGRILPYLTAHYKSAVCGVCFDLVIIYDEGGEYDSPLKNAIMSEITSSGGQSFVGARAGVHLVNSSMTEKEILRLIYACAGYVAPHSALKSVQPYVHYRPVKILPSLPADTGKSVVLPANNGFYTEDGFVCTGGNRLPWCYILSNPSFGTMLSNFALGFTWAYNSHLCKLTPWSCDATTDNRGEMLLLRIGGRVYDIINGSNAFFGNQRAEYYASAGGVAVRTTVSVPEKGAVKHIDITLAPQDSEAPACAELAYYCEPVCASSKSGSAAIKTVWENDSLSVTNCFDTEKPGKMVLKCEGKPDGFTCDRPGFFNGRWNDRTLAPNANSCAAIFKKVSLGSAESRVSFSIFYFGHLTSDDGIHSLAAKKTERLRPALPAGAKYELQSGERDIDAYFNHFLVDQILHCRMFARTGFYQNGGAWGFRDQLQDSMAAAYFAPDLTKQHLFRAAAKQFECGDVLHWWHNSGDSISGLRSRYRDDPLWLAYAAAHYCRITGDYEMLDTPIPFLEGAALESEENERYFRPKPSRKKASLHAHCLLSFKYSLQLGRHGLLLMGGGDWNDGFNKVGRAGIGESVWLTMFAVRVLKDYKKICEIRGETDNVERFDEMIAKLSAAAQASFEDDRYLRAFCDNGSVLGSKNSRYCRIDIIAQAFAVIAGIGTPQCNNAALDSVFSELVDKKSGLVRLFAPSFDDGDLSRHIGYTANYPAGVRENGGQYTHGAVWFAYALFLSGRPDDGWKILTQLNPTLNKNAKNGRFYAEPYLIPADIGTNPDNYGRSGWNLYTGAAAWYYRTILEAMLGLRIENEKIFFAPQIPSFLNEITICVSRRDEKMQINFTRNGEFSLRQDGLACDYAVFRNNSCVTVTVI